MQLKIKIFATKILTQQLEAIQTHLVHKHKHPVHLKNPVFATKILVLRLKQQSTPGKQADAAYTPKYPIYADKIYLNN
uniref:Uncharacterized protein n=1 Tax=Arundo donax TaxID=35708 RepID=A0A0A9C759_ARUDO